MQSQHYGSLYTQDVCARFVHDGSAFLLAYGATVPVAAEIELRIATGTTEIHMNWIFICDADYTCAVYEATAKTHVGGNVLTAYNRNRNILTASTLTVCHTPGAGADGTAIWSFAGGSNKTTTMVPDAEGVVLKASSAYLLNLTAVQNDIATVLLSWHEG